MVIKTCGHQGSGDDPHPICDNCWVLLHGELCFLSKTCGVCNSCSVEQWRKILQARIKKQKRRIATAEKKTRALHAQLAQQDSDLDKSSDISSALGKNSDNLASINLLKLEQLFKSMASQSTDSEAKKLASPSRDSSSTSHDFKTPTPVKDSRRGSSQAPHPKPRGEGEESASPKRHDERRGDRLSDQWDEDFERIHSQARSDSSSRGASTQRYRRSMKRSRSPSPQVKEKRRQTEREHTRSGGTRGGENITSGRSSSTSGRTSRRDTAKNRARQPLEPQSSTRATRHKSPKKAGQMSPSRDRALSSSRGRTRAGVTSREYGRDKRARDSADEFTHTAKKRRRDRSTSSTRWGREATRKQDRAPSVTGYGDRQRQKSQSQGHARARDRTRSPSDILSLRGKSEARSQRHRSRHSHEDDEYIEVSDSQSSWRDKEERRRFEDSSDDGLEDVELDRTDLLRSPRKPKEKVKRRADAKQFLYGSGSDSESSEDRETEPPSGYDFPFREVVKLIANNADVTIVPLGRHEKKRKLRLASDGRKDDTPGFVALTTSPGITAAVQQWMEEFHDKDTRRAKKAVRFCEAFKCKTLAPSMKTYTAGDKALVLDALQPPARKYEWLAEPAQRMTIWDSDVQHLERMARSMMRVLNFQEAVHQTLNVALEEPFKPEVVKKLHQCTKQATKDMVQLATSWLCTIVQLRRDGMLCYSDKIQKHHAQRLRHAPFVEDKELFPAVLLEEIDKQHTQDLTNKTMTQTLREERRSFAKGVKGGSRGQQQAKQSESTYRHKDRPRQGQFR